MAAFLFFLTIAAFTAPVYSSRAPLTSAAVRDPELVVQEVQR